MSANQIRRMFTRLRSNTAIVASATAMALAVCAPSTKASLFGGDVVPATSEHDPALMAGLVQLSPSVSPDEARRVAFTAYTTGRQLAVEWRMVWPPTSAHLASFTLAAPPRRIALMTFGGTMSVGTPRRFIAVSGRPPIA